MVGGVARRILIAALISVFGTTVVAAEQIRASRIDKSAFRDAWHAILAEAGIESDLVAAPRDERRQMFVKGDLLLDCCSVEAWRNRPEEVDIQLWSDPFFYTVDHLILQAGRKYDLANPQDLRAYRVGVVQGFSYRNDQLFGARVERVSLGEVFDAVVTGKADLTIANHQEFQRRQKLSPRLLVLGPIHHRLALKARVHGSRPDLLARINDAIAALKADGRIVALTGTRLRQQ